MVRDESSKKNVCRPTDWNQYLMCTLFYTRYSSVVVAVVVDTRGNAIEFDSIILSQYCVSILIINIAALTIVHKHIV